MLAHPDADIVTPATISEIEDFWILADYTLDDGTMKSVPAGIQDVGEIGISFSSAESLGVQSGLCESYQISYLLHNDVLTTSDPVFPEFICFGDFGDFGDTDNAERSELMYRAFLNSQTLIAVSGNFLTVTTMQNEKLEFVRSTL